MIQALPSHEAPATQRLSPRQPALLIGFSLWPLALPRVSAALKADRARRIAELLEKLGDLRKMTKPVRTGSGFPVVQSFTWLLTIALFLIPVVGRTQERDDDHEHDHHLHFSHPLVTESPSPDTKIRLDYLATNISGGPG